MKFLKKNLYLELVAIALVQVFFLVNLKFTAWPEMTLWPYLMTKGWLPYRDIAIAHTPLMLIDLGIFYKIFGIGILQLKIFTWILILGTDILVYWTVKKLWNAKVAVFTLIFYIVSMLFYDGNGLWFDLYMGLFAFISFYFVRRRRFFWTGVFWALAFVSKQTAVWFLIPIGLEIVQSTEYKVQSFKKLIFGSLAILFILAILLLLFGILPNFYEWAIRFGIFVLPKAQGQVQLPDVKNLIVSLFPFSIFIPFIWKTKIKNLSLLFWAIAGSLGAYPRFEYFHFQPALPYLAIAVAIFFTNEVWKNPLIKIFAIFYVAGSLYLFSGFFMRNYKEGVRFYEKDVQDIVLYVKSNTAVTDKIFVMNWWDSIYALSDRLPATDPWVPQLSWYMETPGLQEKMVKDLQINNPKIILLNPYSEVGLSAYIPQKVYNYVMKNYTVKEKVGGIKVMVPNNTPR